MRFNDSLRRALFSFLTAAALAATLAASGGAAAQDAAKQNPPPASKGEVELGQKINKAPDAAAKLALAEEFVKKYPKSAYRQQLSEYVGGEVNAVTDPAQKLTLVEKYIAAFNAPGEGDRMTPVLIDLYVTANRLDDAYRVAAPWLTANPSNVRMRTRLALVGIGEAQKQNPKFATQSIEYARQAVALMEAPASPAGETDAAQWQTFKAQWQPQLHQALGIVAWSANNAAEARTHFDKAIALNIADPTTFVLSADLADREYVAMAEKYKSMSPGAEQDAQLKRALEKLDQAIDLYARAVAHAEGKPEYAALRTQVMEPLTAYYKYRHNGSTDGLQQLIDKHKPAAKP
ncbi:MAG TPA: hypothetical protein VFX96_20420 [Pyrinomonadaceae bacterium]|nr:hypothetical protein [Pyrinomonadaceae bacterium]